MGAPSQTALNELRDKAEELFLREPQRRPHIAVTDATALARELQLHQLELQMQNEQLRQLQVETADVRDRYVDLYELAPIAYLTLDERSFIHEANLSAATLLAVPRDHVVSRAFSSFFAQEHADRLHLHLADVFTIAGKHSCTLIFGDDIPLHVDSIAFTTQDGAKRCRSVVVDMSKLHRAEEGLRASESRNSSILDTVPDAVVTSDATGRIESFSNAAELMFGYSEHEVVGHNVRMLMPEPHRAQHQGYVERYIDTGIAHIMGRPNRELVGLRKDGTTFAMELGIGEWWSRGQRKFTAIVHDITERKRAEEQLRQAQKMEAVGALASGIAHDFNNILQAILGCLGVALASKELPPVVREYVEYAAGAARRGGDLSSRLATFARPHESTPAQLVIDDVLRNVAGLIERLVTEQVRVTVRPGAGDSSILADAVQIEQILMNLAANARDAMPDGGVLDIRSSVIHDGTAQYVSLAVRDSGMGMDAQTRARIFEPFFTTKAPGKGTGLGLATVFALTRQLGGKVDVDTQEGRGTCFTLRFPLGDGGKRTAPEPAAVDIRLSGTVLLVEDEALVRLTVRHALEELGITVLEARDALEAQDLCNAHGATIDVLVSDVVMPTMRGPKLATLLRQRVPSLGVVFISANPSFSSDEIASVPGASVLQKPFRRDELAAQLSQVLSGRSEQPAVAPQSREVQQRRILVVEDEPVARMALVQMLTDTGYDVVAAAGGSEALSTARGSGAPIDLILTDVRLPDMDGTDLAAHLTTLSPQSRIVYMSGLQDPPAGAAIFVRKPIDFARLLDVIERTLALPDAAGAHL